MSYKNVEQRQPVVTWRETVLDIHLYINVRLNPDHAYSPVTLTRVGRSTGTHTKANIGIYRHISLWMVGVLTGVGLHLVLYMIMNLAVKQKQVQVQQVKQNYFA